MNNIITINEPRLAAKVGGMIRSCIANGQDVDALAVHVVNGLVPSFEYSTLANKLNIMHLISEYLLTKFIYFEELQEEDLESISSKCELCLEVKGGRATLLFYKLHRFVNEEEFGLLMNRILDEAEEKIRSREEDAYIKRPAKRQHNPRSGR